MEQQVILTSIIRLINMKLNVLERVTALRILPLEGNFATLKIVNNLRMALSLTEEEYSEFEVKQDGTQATWNAKGAEEREVNIGEKATDIMVEALKALDKEKKLTNSMFSLYEKFVNDTKA